MIGKEILGLPTPFENTCYREYTLKVATRQKQGHKMISDKMADNGQCLPLPRVQLLKQGKIELSINTWLSMTVGGTISPPLTLDHH